MSADDELGKTTPRSVPPEAPGHRGSLGQPLPREAAGRYAVPEGVRDVELGRGGMGRVLRLAEVSLSREVAVKELLPEHRDSPAAGALMAQFIREARVLARLEHPGVTPIYELGQREDGTLYYSMRRIRGRTLEAVLGDCASLADRLALLPHVLDVVQTVASAHAHGVVHRDLKPANVMVGPYGETLVVDWGLAVVDGQVPGGGNSAGTPAYMSPEQAAGLAVDARSDLWALGACLYEVLTGRLPFEGGTVTEVLLRVQEGVISAPRTVDPHIPLALEAVCLRALRKDPLARFESAQAMAEALQAAMGARETPSRLAPWAVAAVAGVAALACAGWALKAATDGDEVAARAARHVAEARAGAAAPLEREALGAWRSREAVRASALVAAAGGTPLSRGLGWLLEERGVPERAWQAGPAAGCSAVVVVGREVACATLGGVELFSLEEGRPTGRLSCGPTGWQQALAVVGPGRVGVVGDDRTLRVFDVAARRELSRADGLGAGGTALAADGERLMVGLRDGRVGQIEAGGFREQHRLGSAIRALAMRGGVVASSASGELRIEWGPGLVATLPRTAQALMVLEDGRVAAGVERSVVLFSPAAPPVALSGHRDDVLALSWTQGRLVSGGADGVVRALFASGELDSSWDGERAGVQALAEVGPEGAGVVVADRRRGLARWRLPEPGSRLPEDGVPVAHLWTAQGWMLSGLKDGRIRRFDAAAGPEAVAFVEAAHRGAVRALAQVKGVPSPARLRFLSGGEDGRVLAQRWSGEVVVLDEAPNLKVTALAVDDAGARAAWAFSDGSRVLYGLEGMKVIAREQDSLVTALAFAPGAGRVLAAGREDKRVSLLDADTFRELGRLEETDGPVAALAFSADGRRLYTGDRSGAVTAWDLAARRREHLHRVSEERVGALAVSADGSRLAAGGDDGVVSVLDTATWATVASVPADSGDVVAVQWAPDGALLAVGTDRLPHRWTVRPGGGP